jgi:hypothetical protein
VAEPEPPHFPPDPRQDRFQAIVGKITGAAGEGFAFAAANTSNGFPASAVDVGRLKTALEGGLASFDMALVRDRWDTDVFDWLNRTVLGWVQRCKVLGLRPGESGIQVEMETQDDLGHYNYSFDVLPGKK